MKKSLKIFRDEYLELLLDFLWQEWSALGVAGQKKDPCRHVIDPEALLLFTCSLGRYDQRLFDEVMDWLTTNGRFINVHALHIDGLAYYKWTFHQCAAHAQYS